MSQSNSKIKIRDFRKDNVKQTKKVKKRKFERVNPIYTSNDLNYDDYDYMEKIKLEREVLGDF